MYKKKGMKIGLLLVLVLSLGWSVAVPGKALGQTESLSDVQEKLEGISQEEREVLQGLFLLLQEIEEMEREEVVMSQEIAVMNQEIQDLEGLIAEEEGRFQKKSTALKEVLRSYQRSGPGSYLEIILSSDSIKTLIRRINALRDLTRNTGELLDDLENSQDKLTLEKKDFDEKLRALEEKQVSLREAIERNIQLRNEQEAYLASLDEERDYYQEYFTSLQQEWDNLKPFFSETIGVVSQMISERNLPFDAVKTSFTLLGVKGTIDEKTFNDIFSGNPLLSELKFSFLPGKIQMELPEKNLVLAGDFVIQDGQTLMLQIKEGSFYGMSLEPSSIEELFRQGNIHFDLQPLIGNNTLQSIEIKQGYIDILARLSLF